MVRKPTYSIEDEEVSVKEIIENVQTWVSYLLSKWRILLIAGIAGGGLGLAYALFWEQPEYTATTTFVLESNDSKSGLGRLAGMAAIAGIDLGGNTGGIFQGDNILELYKSRAMLEQTLLAEVHPDSNQLLIERYIAYNEIKDDWKDQPELLNLDFRRDPETLDSLTHRLRNGAITSFANAIRKDVLRIEKIEKNLSILRVDVTSPDEVFSKAFNENLVKKVNEFYIQTKTKKTSDNIALLQEMADSVRAVMTGAIYSAARVSDATPNLNPTRQVQRIAPAQEAQFSAETNKLILSQLQQNLELTKMALLQEQPLIQLVDRPVYPLPVNKIGIVKGIVIGGFVFGFFALLIIVLRKYYRDVMAGGSEEQIQGK